MAKSEEMTYYIRPEQLCLGLFVHLDLSWMDHPFTFSSFKIKSADQIETLRHLGLEKIRYSPTKSDQHPLPQQEEKAPAPTVDAASIVEFSQEEQAILDAKRQRLEHLKTQRAAIEACEKDFMATARIWRYVVTPRNTFCMPSCTSVTIPSRIATLRISADLALRISWLRSSVRGITVPLMLE